MDVFPMHLRDPPSEMRDFCKVIKLSGEAKCDISLTKTFPPFFPLKMYPAQEGNHRSPCASSSRACFYKGEQLPERRQGL